MKYRKMVLTYVAQRVSTTTNLSVLVDTVFVNATDPTVNLNLPAIVADGQRYLIKRVDSSSNAVYLIPNGTDTVGGSSSQYMGNGQIVELVSYMANWEYCQNLSL